MPVTATRLPDPADLRTWYKLTGTDNGTGCKFNGDVFAVCPDSTIVDSEGCPLTEGDHETIAVRNSLPGE